MDVLKQYFMLANGIKIPKLGFGTWQIPEGEIVINSVTAALECGYRHIDTAEDYQNEVGVGLAIKKSGLSRKEIFITSKLPSHIKTYAEAKAHLRATLKRLDIDYLDLYLIHAPWPWSDIGRDCKAGNKEVWRAFEEDYQLGLIRSIGVSNFSKDDLLSLFETAKIIPMVNQIAFFIGHNQSETRAFCRENNILIEAYSPFATGRLLDNPQLKAIADKYGVSVPQLALRYCLAQNTLPLPKSTHREYIKQNTAINFDLDDSDVRLLEQFNNDFEF